MTENTTTQHDQYYEMANAPVNRIIPKLAVPTIISMLVTSIYNMADTFFVKPAGNQCFWCHRHCLLCHGNYPGAVLHGRHGKRQLHSPIYRCRKAGTGRTSCSVAFFTGLIIGLLIAVFGNLSLRNIVYFLGATETIAPFAEDYARYIFMAAPFM